MISKRYSLCPRHFLYFGIFGILSEVVNMTTPYVIKEIVDLIDQKIFDERILQIAWIWITIAIIEIAWERFSRTIHSYITSKIKNILTIKYYNIIAYKNISTIQNIWTGKIQTRINNWIDAEISLLSTLLSSLQPLGVRLIIIILIFSYTLPWLNLMFIWLAGIVIFSHKIVEWKVKPRNKKIRKINEESGKLGTKIIMEHQIVSLSNKQEHETLALWKSLQELPKLSRTTDFLNDIWYSILELLFRSTEIACYLYIGYEIIYTGKYTLWEMVMIVWYIGWLRWPTSTIIQNLWSIRKQRERYNSLQRFLNKKNPISDWIDEFIYKKWEINIKIIDFNYKEWAKLFEKFSLSFLPGKTTAVVGHSGSWKSSLIKLILRQYVPNNWSIEVDNQNIIDLTQESRYNSIWYISQTPSVFDGTIKDNLLYALSDKEIEIISEEKKEEILRKALHQTHLDELIKSKPQWLLTKIGEKWLKLSWGEQQRLALARLFIKNPPIIILDEPTSALDSISEHHITQSLKKLTQWKTVIVIAHRLQTVMHADNIIVLDHGKIVEEWTHNELINKQWAYSQLVNLQSWIIME